MNRPIRSLVLAVFGLTAAASCSAQNGAPAAKNMLWRVGNDKGSIYILGSVHMLPKSMYPLASPIERAFDSSDRVVFELNLDSVTAMGGAMSMLMQGMYMDGRTLKSAIAPALYKQTSKRLKKLGYDIAMFNRFKPWVVALMLMGLDGQEETGMQAEYGIDMYFHKRAGETSKPVAGLERMEDQIGIFSTLGDKEQEALLLQTLNQKEGTGELKAILAAWKGGDVAAMEKILAKQLASDPGMYDGLLFARNNNWVPQIEGFITSGKRYLVIVGAMHLVGPRGVIELLKAKGYHAEQL